MRNAVGQRTSKLEDGMRRQRASEARLHQILSLMPAAVYTCDASGRITFFNRRAVELWGREPELNAEDWKFCGSCKLFRDGVLLRPDRVPMADALRERKSLRNVEAVIERPDGSRSHVLISIDPVFDDDGRFSGAINVFQDTTERKSAERTIQALSTPVLEVYERMLVLPLIGGFDAERSRQLTAQLLASIRQHRARVVVLDLTGMATIDEPVANHLRQTVLAARLLGAEVIFSGISRQVAQILTAIGFTPGEVTTVSNLRAGIEAAERLLGRATAQPLAVPVHAR